MGETTKKVWWNKKDLTTPFDVVLLTERVIRAREQKAHKTRKSLVGFSVLGEDGMIKIIERPVPNINVTITSIGSSRQAIEKYPALFELHCPTCHRFLGRVVSIVGELRQIIKCGDCHTNALFETKV